MVPAVIAQPAEPMVSLAEVPSGAPAQAASCCPMTAMLMELSAEAPTWLPRAETTAMAPASAAARRLKLGLSNLTNRGPRVDGRTSAAHLEGRVRGKQTTTVIQGGRARTTQYRQPLMGGKSRARLRTTTCDVTAAGRYVPITTGSS